MTSTPGPLFPADPILVLDGGLASELAARGHDLGDALWSARCLLDAPDAIRDVHRDYLEAGADVVISASYQASFEGLRGHGLSDADAERVLRRSVEIAREACDGFWDVPENRRGRRPPRVAASVGPYGAFRADGSEFTGDYDLDAQGLLDFHARRFAVLADTGADLLACETIPSRTEARVLADLVDAAPGVQAWISFSCRDGRHLADGSDLADVVAEIDGADGLVAIGVNCVPPERVDELLRTIASATRKPLVAYPNLGETWDAERRDWIPRPESFDFAAAARRWQDAGARLLGGCCRTGPREILAVRDGLR